MKSPEITFIFFLLIVLLACCGLLLALTPWLMKRRECFAVTVPEIAQRDKRLRVFKVHYTVIMVALTAVFVCIAAACFALYDEAGFVMAIVLGTLLLSAAGFMLMLYYRRKVMRIKTDEGWGSTTQESVALVVDAELPQPLSLKCSWIYAVIAAVTLTIGIVGYPLMPDMVPMHADFEGNVDRWEPKSPVILLFPLLIQLFLVACFMFCHWIIVRSKKGTDPEMPVASTLAYALFARAQSIYIVAAGVLTSAMMIPFILSMLGVLTITEAAMIIMVLILPVVGGAIALSVVYGQSGARVIKRVTESEELRFDDDACWKLGVFYWNPHDASLFVPERFGIGWTMNYARPAAWAAIAGIVLLDVAFVVGVFLLV